MEVSRRNAVYPTVFSRMKQRIASPRQLEQERWDSVSRCEIDRTGRYLFGFRLVPVPFLPINGGRFGLLWVFPLCVSSGSSLVGKTTGLEQ